MSQKTIGDYFGITKKEVKKEERSFIDEIPLDQRIEIGRSKILFLPKLIRLLHRKCKTLGGCTPDIINNFY